MVLLKCISILLVALFMQSSSAFRVNMTKVENCPHIKREFPYALISTEYLWNGDVIDGLRGTYIVRDNDKGDRDVIAKLFKCPTRTEVECNENIEERTYTFPCERYLKEIGPWSLMTESMDHDVCHHPLGTFELNEAKFDLKILEGHLKIDPKYTNYRLMIEFTTRSVAFSDPEEEANLRACVVIIFDTIYD